MTRNEIIADFWGKEENPLSKSSVDEPVFVLVARDRLAPATIIFWCVLARLFRVPRSKLDGARADYKAMLSWAKKNGSKVPD